MRKLILKMSVSVDGFVGGPNGEIDWIFRSMDKSAAKWTVGVIWQAGVHIMGSRTFHDMAAYWPYSDEIFAAPMNEIPKVVFSKNSSIKNSGEELTTRAFEDASKINKPEGLKTSTQNLATWTNAAVAAGDLKEEIIRLKQQPGKDILAHGGATFAQSLVRTGLIDEYQLLVHPVALGAGLPLFSALPEPIDLKLVSATMFGSGAVAHVYQPQPPLNLPPQGGLF